MKDPCYHSYCEYLAVWVYLIVSNPFRERERESSAIKEEEKYCESRAVDSAILFTLSYEMQS